MKVYENEFTIVEGEIEIISDTQIHVPTNKGVILLNADEFGYSSAIDLKNAIIENVDIEL